MKFDLVYHDSFKNFFDDNILSMLGEISEKVENFTPSKELVLRFAQCNLDKVKVIWLGQDPYFQPKVATGRSFEASNVKSWDDKFKQISLKNIIRGIYRAYYPQDFESVNTYSNIMIERRLNNFRLLEPKEWFDSLEEQGVMFLNTYFTCEVNKPNSHRKLWEEFSKKLFEYIHLNNPNIKWFLWGNEAKKVLNIFPTINYYASNHPMLCSIKNEEDFLNNRCFIETKEIINWLG